MQKCFFGVVNPLLHHQYWQILKIKFAFFLNERGAPIEKKKYFMHINYFLIKLCPL